MYTYKATRNTCYLGSIIQAISVNVPPVLFIIFQEEYGIGYAQLGTLVLLTFAIQIVVDLILAKVAHRFTTRNLLKTAAGLALAGYALIALAPVLFRENVFIGLLMAVLVYSAGSGFLEVMVSPVIDALPSGNKGSSMAFLHSFYCWGQLGSVLLTTVLLYIAGRENWQWIMAFWMLFPAVNFYLLTRVPLPAMQSSAQEKGGVKKMLSMHLFWAALMIMIAAGASEQSMAQWASLFAQKGLHLSKALGDLAGPCFFALLMGTGRLMYGLKGAAYESQPHKMKHAMQYSALLCMASYLITVLAPWPAMSLLGLGLCGLSVAIMWPGTLVMASRAMPSGGTALFAFMALGGDIGCSVGPWLTGMVTERLQHAGLGSLAGLTAEQMALRGGLLCALLFPMVLLIFIPILTKSRKEEHV